MANLPEFTLLDVTVIVGDSLRHWRLQDLGGCVYRLPICAREVHGEVHVGRTEATAKGWAMVSIDFREPDVHTESAAYQSSLVSTLEAQQREMPVNPFDRRAASEAWSAGVRAAVARLEEERKAADARRLGWDPELTGGEE